MTLSPITFQLLACFCVFLGTLTQTGQIQKNAKPPMPTGPTSDTTKWVDRLATQHRDNRGEASTRTARMKDTDSVAHIINTLTSTLNGKRKEGLHVTDYLTFALSYRPIWKGDQLQKPEWDLRLGRIQHLSDDVIQQWRKALEVVHEDGVSTLWTIGFLIDIDRLFGKDGFDATQSEILLGSLRLAPRDAVGTLAQTLNIGRAWSGILIIQNDDLYAQGAFRQARFDEAIRRLNAKISAL